MSSRSAVASDMTFLAYVMFSRSHVASDMTCFDFSVSSRSAVSSLMTCFSYNMSSRSAFALDTTCFAYYMSSWSSVASEMTCVAYHMSYRSALALGTAFFAYDMSSRSFFCPSRSVSLPYCWRALVVSALPGAPSQSSISRAFRRFLPSIWYTHWSSFWLAFPHGIWSGSLWRPNCVRTAQVTTDEAVWQGC